MNELNNIILTELFKVFDVTQCMFMFVTGIGHDNKEPAGSEFITPYRIFHVLIQQGSGVLSSAT